jgi:hypothetical protein
MFREVMKWTFNALIALLGWAAVDKINTISASLRDLSMNVATMTVSMAVYQTSQRGLENSRDDHEKRIRYLERTRRKSNDEAEYPED